jgi:hypothetical protein
MLRLSLADQEGERANRHFSQAFDRNDVMSAAPKNASNKNPDDQGPKPRAIRMDGTVMEPG